MSETTWEQFKANVNKFISRPSPQPPFSGPVEAEGENGLAIGRDSSQRLAISALIGRNAAGRSGKYFVDFLPLGVCVAEYTYGTERRRVPIVLSNETVKQMLGDTGGTVGHVRFTNIPIVQRVPIEAG